MTARQIVEPSTEPSTIAVVVAKPYLVGHDGEMHGPGTALDLPDDERTASWLALGWVIPKR